MNLLIISHTPHYQTNSQVVGWGPTVREIDHLASLFTQVDHLAPLHSDPAPASALAYSRDNIHYTPVKPAGGEGMWAKLDVILRLPDWVVRIHKAIKEADIVHIRCPAGISLIALLAFSIWGQRKPCWVKYAGNWQPDDNQPLSYRLQRWLLTKNIHHGVVTINGNWPDQPDHIRTLNNPSLTMEEYQIAKQMANNKYLTDPIQLLFVGRLDRDKGVDQILEIIKHLETKAIDFRLTLVGDGPDRAAYEKTIKTLGLESKVIFTSWLPPTKVHEHYHRAHLIIFPSTSEGWPKVLSEAMAYGVVPIASAISSIPQTLSKIGAGKAIPPKAINEFVNAIQFYIENPAIWEIEHRQCLEAGIGYTYENYIQVIQSIFSDFWQVDLKHDTTTKTAL